MRISTASAEQGVLRQSLQQILPLARLEVARLPGCCAIQLLLLNSDYPQAELTPQEMQQVMDNPLYWVFCWASGQVLAEFLLLEPALPGARAALCRTLTNQQNSGMSGFTWRARVPSPSPLSYYWSGSH